jgi:hypothetical protein
MTEQLTCNNCNSYAFYKECEKNIEKKINILFCKACEKPCNECYCCDDCGKTNCDCCRHCHLSPIECNCCQKCGNYKHKCICNLCRDCGLDDAKCRCAQEEQEEQEKEEYDYWLESMCGPFRCEDCNSADCKGNC